MFKSRLLSSVVVFAPDDEKGAEKTPVQIEREKIQVTTSKQTEQKEEDAKGEVDKDDAAEGEQGAEDDVEEGEESGEDTEKEEGEKEEELNTEQKENAKLRKAIERLQRRVGKTTGEKAAIAQQLADAQKSLNAKAEAGEGLTEEEVERRAELKAEQKASEREFQRAVNNLTKAATKVDPEFMVKINEVAQSVAPIPPYMIGALEDLDNGGNVLAYLADNEDEYEEIIQMTPAKMTSRLVKISNTLDEEAKPKKKAISKAPAPIDRIKGGSESPNVLPDKPNKDAASMEKFVKMRAIQVEQRRRQKLGLN